MGMAPSWIGPASDAIVALAAVLGAGIAVVGLRTWKAQLRGTAHFECARRLMLAVLGVRTAIQSLRVPMMFTGELASAVADRSAAVYEQIQKLTPQSKIDPSIEATVAVYERRWQAVEEARSQYRVLLLEARLYWPDGLEEADKQLNELMQRLFVDLYLYKQHLTKEWNPAEHAESQERIQGTVFRSGADDQFTMELGRAIGRFEALLGDVLRERPRRSRRRSSGKA